MAAVEAAPQHRAHLSHPTKLPPLLNQALIYLLIPQQELAVAMGAGVGESKEPSRCQSKVVVWVRRAVMEIEAT
jgi:hypothetical protein